MDKFSRRQVVMGLAISAPVLPLMSSPLWAKQPPMDSGPVTLTTTGGRKVGGVLYMPAKLPAPAILVLHDWMGMSVEALANAANYSKMGYMVLAADLYGGKVVSDKKAAMSLIRGLDKEAAADTVSSWLHWLKNHPNGTRKVAALGYSLGGGWALRGSIAEPLEATVVYYGYLKEKAERLAALKGPVLGHFAEKDKRVNHKMVGQFEAEMKKAGKTFTPHWYDAGHAFFNSKDPRYNEQASKLSTRRTLAFLKKTLDQSAFR